MFSLSRTSLGARIIRTKGLKIHENIAFETLMIDTLQPTEPILFLWQNAPCIVVGRYQNVWSECDLDATKRDGVAISRRFTGGGAVYHDLGNVCFSVVAPKSKYSVVDQNKLILDTLKTNFGIEGVQSGRNDLCIREGNLKFSGQSFRHVRDHSLHNGTIMLNVDVDGLGRYLTPDKSKLEAKGVKSVKSRVVNLSTINKELTSETFMAALASSFAEAHGISPAFQEESVEKLLNNDNDNCGGGGDGFATDGRDIKAKYDALVAKLTSWDFIYGETPQFSHNLGVRRLSAGTFDLKINVDKGVVKDAAVFSDCLDTLLVESLQAKLNSCVGAKYKKEALLKLFTATSSEEEARKVLNYEIGEWIKESF